MCGIAGIIRFDGASVDPTVVQAMMDAIAHRGPDGEGKHVDAGVGLGHRRLSIIDLEGGAQPMSTPDGRCWVTYNGEIYNFAELRTELQRHGCEFRTRCDTEVILHAYRQWGDNCVRRFRGMFAFCVVDFDKREFLLARDHFGIKPVLYAASADFIAFGSEFAVFHQVPDLRLTGSLQAVEWFLRFQYIPAPETIYREIRKLQPGHYLSGKLDAPVGEPTCYYSVEFQADEAPNAEEWFERLDSSLNESVKAHLIADVPVGAFLSGGVDSTSVVACMKKLVSSEMVAYSIGFEDPSYSELPYAQEAATQLGVELRSDIATDDYWDDFPKLVAHYGEPFGDNSMIPTWRLAELARRDVPVALSGDGGDEAFGGYNTYGLYHAVPKVKEYWRRLRKRLGRSEFAAFLWAIGRSCFNRQEPMLSAWTNIIRYTSTERRRKLWRPEFSHLVDAPNASFLAADTIASRGDMVAYAQSIDFRTNLPGVMLTKVDIASMYHGLEVRTPLLDVEVVKVASALPAEHRFRYEDESFVGKAILKDWLARMLSREFVHRPKQGFGVPRKAWFSQGRAGRAYYEDVVRRMGIALSRWFDPTAIGEMGAEHSEKRDRSSGMWLMLVLSLWLEQNQNLTFD